MSLLLRLFLQGVLCCIIAICTMYLAAGKAADVAIYIVVLMIYFNQFNPNLRL